MKTIIGNWKMHGTASALVEVEAIAEDARPLTGSVQAWLCLPATLLTRAQQTIGQRPLGLGGQTCHTSRAGAHTGDLSADMLVDAGATLTLVGHSERRQDHHETNALVRAQAFAALEAGLTVVVCVGETAAERKAGQANDIIRYQLSHSLPTGHRGLHEGRVMIAYEPIWSIGTGHTPTNDEIIEIHATIRAFCGKYEPHPELMRLLYGGSVKPENAANILSLRHVDGVLVGGASLKAADFSQIMRSGYASALANAV
jgi:triosephosphate isomerase